MKRIITTGPFPVVGCQTGTKSSLFHHFPSMEKLSNGEVLLCCKELHGSMNDPKGKVLLFRSANEGETWSKEIPPTCHDEARYPEKGYIMAHITEIEPNELIAVYGLIDTDINNPMFNP